MFRFHEVKAGVLQVSELSIPAKAITCIIGESGSGKTTLLRLLNVLDNPEEGEIWFDGVSLNEVNPVEWRRKAVMVPQSPVMFKGTVEDNLQVGRRFAGQPAATQEQMMQALFLFSLDKELSQAADNLSGGEKQRLALARAVLMEPFVLLLDEPTSALDEATADTLMQRLSAYTRERNVTVVMITHSRTIAQTYADFTVEVKNGIPHMNGGLQHARNG
ncbi:ABC transporter ATP-binding protein [Paenibacillus beijingensis]|uniref:ABC transporter domain-containing protein n=1 Tax=Paenibacillus beijingensis TaxID=1126833 RepID=A0A0D5NNH3_9BACL|nr:ABC transporter ATP-binding protein [Paenibacillus beijingensis]AJY76821.1 hypothetical protein VN24_22470 [Paenibacillus beijingensis]